MYIILRWLVQATLLNIIVFCHAEILSIPRTEPTRTPIDVSQLHLSNTVDIDMLVESIENDRLIGAIGEGFFCDIVEGIAFDPKRPNFIRSNIQKSFAYHSEQAGYPRYESDISAFENHLASAPDFSIALTVNDLKFKACQTGTIIDRDYAVYGHGYIKARWELQYAKLQNVAYSKTLTATYAVDKDKPIRFQDFLNGIMDQLINNALADPDYVAAYTHPETSTSDVPKAEKNVDTAQP